MATEGLPLTSIDRRTRENVNRNRPFEWRAPVDRDFGLSDCMDRFTADFIGEVEISVVAERRGFGALDPFELFDMEVADYALIDSLRYEIFLTVPFK
jgi:hypothetical protein